jgi:hypothetical protein
MVPILSTFPIETVPNSTNALMVLLTCSIVLLDCISPPGRMFATGPGERDVEQQIPKTRKLPDTAKGNTVGRAHSTLSVSAVDYYLNLPVSSPPSPAISTVTLTPGRIRNIDQDMEALRASRQDNPFIQVYLKQSELVTVIIVCFFCSKLLQVEKVL